jgi:hypothetical protein
MNAQDLRAACQDTARSCASCAYSRHRPYTCAQLSTSSSAARKHWSSGLLGAPTRTCDRASMPCDCVVGAVPVAEWAVCLGESILARMTTTTMPAPAAARPLALHNACHGVLLERGLEGGGQVSTSASAGARRCAGPDHTNEILRAGWLTLYAVDTGNGLCLAQEAHIAMLQVDPSAADLAHHLQGTQAHYRHNRR